MNKKWSEEEASLLAKLSKNHTDKEIYEIFNRKYKLSTITKKRQRLGVKKSENGRPVATPQNEKEV